MPLGTGEGQDRATARTIADPSQAHGDSWLFCARYDEPQRVSDIQLALVLASNDRQSISRSILCLFVRSSADARRPRLESCLNLHSVSKRPADRVGPTRSCLAHLKASPSLYRSSWDRVGRDRSTATCAVPCRREVAPESNDPRNGGKSVSWLGPWGKSAAGPNVRQ